MNDDKHSECVPQDNFHLYDPEGATCRCGGEARAPIAPVDVVIGVWAVSAAERAAVGY